MFELIGPGTGPPEPPRPHGVRRPPPARLAGDGTSVREWDWARPGAGDAGQCSGEAGAARPPASARSCCECRRRGALAAPSAGSASAVGDEKGAAPYLLATPTGQRPPLMRVVVTGQGRPRSGRARPGRRPRRWAPAGVGLVPLRGAGGPPSPALQRLRRRPRGVWHGCPLARTRSPATAPARWWRRPWESWPSCLTYGGLHGGHDVGFGGRLRRRRPSPTTSSTGDGRGADRRGRSRRAEIILYASVAVASFAAAALATHWAEAGAVSPVSAADSWHPGRPALPGRVGRVLPAQVRRSTSASCSLRPRPPSPSPPCRPPGRDHHTPELVSVEESCRPSWIRPRPGRRPSPAPPGPGTRG